MVSASWAVGWSEYLVTSREVVILSIDGRGSGFQSDEQMFAVYRALGTVEITDQLAVTRAVLADRPYLDTARTAIWGWSYGGRLPSLQARATRARCREIKRAGIVATGPRFLHRDGAGAGREGGGGGRVPVRDQCRPRHQLASVRQATNFIININYLHTVHIRSLNKVVCWRFKVDVIM